MMILTDIIPSVEEAFTAGTLVMPTEVVPSVREGFVRWGDCALNAWLIAISAIVIVADIKGFYYIFGDLCKCLSRWRWNITAENSMQFARERDIFAMLCILPLTVMLSRFDVFSAKFLGKLDGGWNTAAVFGILAGYLLFRLFNYGALRQKARRVSGWQVARAAGKNIFIIFCLVAGCASGALWILGVSDLTVRYAIIAIAAFFYLIVLFQKNQILGSSCNPFTTFLYLCALELLPTGLLIAANICL